MSPEYEMPNSISTQDNEGVPFNIGGTLSPSSWKNLNGANYCWLCSKCLPN